MKILFKQNKTCNALKDYGINDCYLKEISSSKPNNHITKSSHHHKDFEIHIIQNGHCIYEADDDEYTAKEGYYFLIPPKKRHKMLFQDKSTVKYALSFNIAQPHGLNKCYIGKVPQRFFENIHFIKEENEKNKFISCKLTEHSVMESIIILLRSAGYEENTVSVTTSDENHTITMAKKYISANTDMSLTAKSLAEYCHISPRQLSRIFNKYESTSPMQYIASQRTERIRYYLKETDLTLSEISDRMHFPNEYYFNTFSAKHLGMPPGAYRKMHTEY